MISTLARLTHANRVRRNHALEHAAISVVSERQPEMRLRGRSNRKGFYIYGNIDTSDLRSAISEGSHRLRSGETELAIHPRCGTNLAVAGILSGLAAAAAVQLKPRQNRFAYAVMASLAALMAAAPIGTAAQRHVTTSADLADLEVVDVQRRYVLGNPSHWVRTRST